MSYRSPTFGLLPGPWCAVMANADRDGPQEVLDAEEFADVDRWKVYNRFSGIVEFVRVSRRWRAMSRLVAQSTFLALDGFFL